MTDFRIIVTIDLIKGGDLPENLEDPGLLLTLPRPFLPPSLPLLSLHRPLLSPPHPFPFLTLYGER